MQEPVCRRNLSYLLLIVPAFLPVPTSVTVYGEAVFDPGAAAGAQRALPAGRAPQSVALYEMVEGARVSGRAPAGATVRFDLPLRLPDGTLLGYAARAQADAGGRYEIRLPYPTRDVDPLALRSAASDRVRVGEQDARLELGEADVREGRDVAGPSFAGPSFGPGAGDAR